MPTRHSLAVSGALALVAATGLAGPSLAQPSVGEVVVTAPSPLPAGAEIRSKIVKISDLDLRRPEGRETLLGRIRSAALEVCTPRPSHPANFKDADDYNRCINEAMDHAIARVESPELALVYSRVR